MSKSPVISLTDVSFTYRTQISRKPNMMEAIRNVGRGQRSTKLVHALKNVSLDVEQGEVLGIVGANGAGKSTLMRAIGGIVPPDEGEIRVRGEISALLALGVGFNPQLSGRENVVLAGLATGLSRERVEEQYQSIVEFAELEEFMDMPMRTYSSGMYSRLGFAVATNMNPDILLIDEALSTGDAHFKEKSSQRIKDLRDSAGAMVIVSHSMATLKELSSRLLWMHKGEVIATGEPDKIIQAYSQFLKVGNINAVMEDF